MANLSRTLILVSSAGFTLSLALMFQLIVQSPHLSTGRQVENGSSPFDANATAVYAQERVRSGLPVRLRIPSIGVDSAIEYVSLAPDGAMDAPKDSANAGWFDLGPRPGESGSAVIAGHYGWKNGKVSVFDNLYKLRQGDVLYIEDETGEVSSFVVSKTRRYDPTADASDVFGSNDGDAHLNLITCEGGWDEAAQNYSKRLVVFTDKEL